MSFAPPIIDGNQGVFYWTNWDAPAQTNADGSIPEVEIEYGDLYPGAGTPGLLITSCSINVYGVQSPNKGLTWCNIDPEGVPAGSLWKDLCSVFDGEMGRQQNHEPGIRMTPAQHICFKAVWKAYAAGPSPFGNDSMRRFRLQIVYTIER